MSLLKNFRNPWEAATGVLDTGVLDTQVLDIFSKILGYESSEKRPPSLIYTEDGKFLGEVGESKERGEVFIMDEYIYNQYSYDHSSKKAMPIPYNIIQKLSSGEIRNIKTQKIECTKLSALIAFSTEIALSALSAIYTNILYKWGFDTSIIYKQKISIDSISGGKFNDPPKDPSALSEYALTSYDVEGTNSKFKLTINLDQTSSDFGFVANVINALGVHEYNGHGIKRWSSTTKTHYKAYELQFAHFTWEHTTDDFKEQMLRNYLGYILKETPSKYYYQKHAELKKRYGKNKVFDAIWWY